LDISEVDFSLAVAKMQQVWRHGDWHVRREQIRVDWSRRWRSINSLNLLYFL
jgi:hypothetical protein